MHLSVFNPKGGTGKTLLSIQLAAAFSRTERNYPGWHLNADRAGCQSLLSLLDALAADGAGSRSVAITAPTKASRMG